MLTAVMVVVAEAVEAVEAARTLYGLNMKNY